MNVNEKFAYFGSAPLFDEPKPSGCLYRPDIEKVLGYSKVFYDNRRYSNDGALAKQLEKQLAELHDVKRVVLFGNGFFALLLTIDALALPNKKEVIVPSLGYRKLDDIISWAGYVPRFCDIDKESLTPSVAQVEEAISDDTALILIQHSGVGFVDVQGIAELARKSNIPVVNDSALYFGTINGRMVGGAGDAEVFLLNSTKFINGFEGGYVTTNNVSLADRLAAAKRFGFNNEDEVVYGMSLNAKLNEMHAATALAFLDDMEDCIHDFNAQYSAYARLLEGIDGIRFWQHKREQSIYYRQMGMMIELLDSWPLTQQQTLQILNAEKILARAYYSPMHLKEVGYLRIVPELPNTEELHSRLIYLPQGAHVSLDDIEKIGGFIKLMCDNAEELSSQLRRIEHGEI